MNWDGRDWTTARCLFDAAEHAGFDLLLTCDQNVSYQQNLATRAPFAYFTKCLMSFSFSSMILSSKSVSSLIV